MMQHSTLYIARWNGRKIRVVKTYWDKALNRRAKVGEELEVTEERYEVIKKYEAENNFVLVEAVEEKEEKKDKSKKK